MDIEKPIEQLSARGLSNGSSLGYHSGLFDEAVTALSTLQAENKRLNKIVCSIPTTPDSGRTVSQYDKEMSMCAYLDDLEAENEKLRDELEQVREDNKKLCSAMMTIRRSENSERMCAEYRVDYCTALSHQETADLARIAFEGLMREDERMRGPQKED